MNDLLANLMYLNFLMSDATFQILYLGLGWDIDHKFDFEDKVYF